MSETAVIRQFIQQYFDDAELSVFTFDYFPDVHSDFAASMRKGQKVQLLLEHCRRQGRTPDLLAALERERPQPFADQLASIALAPHAPEKPQADGHHPQRVFVSHAHQDAVFARRLADDLEANGWEVWIAPDSINPGEKWVEAIDRGLSTSGIFVLVLTPHAVESRWVKSETNVALELEHQEKIRFIPLLLEPCDLPLVWRTYQHVSFRDRYEAGFMALLNRLSREDRKQPKDEATQSDDELEVEQKTADTPDISPSLAITRAPTIARIAGAIIVLALLILAVRSYLQPDNEGALPSITPTRATGNSARASVDVGSIRPGQSREAQIDGSDTHVWTYDGPETQVDIEIDAGPRDKIVMFVLEPGNDTPVSYVDFLRQGEGELLTFFAIGPGYRIAVEDAATDGADYTMSVRESTPIPINPGDTISGVVVGANPVVYTLEGPVTVDISLAMSSRDLPLLLIFDADERQLAYVDTADEGVVRLTNYELPAGTNKLLIRDATNDGASYQLTVQ